jgi:hypothetical protein
VRLMVLGFRRDLCLWSAICSLTVSLLSDAEDRDEDEEDEVPGSQVNWS